MRGAIAGFVRKFGQKTRTSKRKEKREYARNLIGAVSMLSVTWITGIDCIEIRDQTQYQPNRRHDYRGGERIWWWSTSWVIESSQQQQQQTSVCQYNGQTNNTVSIAVGASRGASLFRSMEIFSFR
jgi:hypothetical protein